MGKKVDDSVLDASLDVIATCNSMRVTAGEPTDLANAITLTLAQVAMVPGDGNDYTIGDGVTSGRKVRTAQKSSVPITATGTADHVCLDDGVTLLHVTTSAPQLLTDGNTVTVPAYDASEIADPV